MPHKVHARVSLLFFSFPFSILFFLCSAVWFSHPNITTLELSYHLGLSWRLDTPALRRLVFIVPISDEAMLICVTNSMKDLLSDQLDQSPYLSQFIVECSLNTPFIQLLDRQSIQLYCSNASSSSVSIL